MMSRVFGMGGQLLLSAVVLWSASPKASAQNTVFHPLTVKRFLGFNAPNVTDARIDQCLSNATSIIQQDSDGAGTNDAACNTNLFRTGAVGTFTVSDGHIDTPAEIGSVQGSPGFIKIVKTITFCSGNPVIGVIAGCTQMNAFNGSVFAETAFSSAACGKVIAHEFGHSVGFGHTTLTNNVMQQGTSTALTYLIAGQCPFLRANCVDHDGPGGAAPAAGCVSPVVGPRIEDTSLDGVSIEELVLRGLGDRVPFEAVDHYSQEDAWVLQDILEDESQVELHAPAARLLGLVGTDLEENVRALKRFIAAGSEDASAMAAAVVSLGYLANRGNASAIRYLIRNVDRTDSEIADWAVSALAVSGHFEAKSHLARIFADADRPNARFKRHGRSRDLASLARDHHALVSRVGLKAYYARH